jgi:uncharacterized membrane protein (UPF0127 family)
MSSITKITTLPLFEEYCRKNDIDGKEIDAEISGIPLKLIVASTPQSQMKGYSDSKASPSGDNGMLFIYDDDQPLSFWMKGVKFGLDIIFFDNSMQCSLAMEDVEYAKWLTNQPCYIDSDDILDWD